MWLVVQLCLIDATELALSAPLISLGEMHLLAIALICMRTVAQYW